MRCAGRKNGASVLGGCVRRLADENREDGKVEEAQEQQDMSMKG